MLQQANMLKSRYAKERNTNMLISYPYYNNIANQTTHQILECLFEQTLCWSMPICLSILGVKHFYILSLALVWPVSKIDLGSSVRCVIIVSVLVLICEVLCYECVLSLALGLLLSGAGVG